MSSQFGCDDVLYSSLSDENKVNGAPSGAHVTSTAAVIVRARPATACANFSDWRGSTSHAKPPELTLGVTPPEPPPDDEPPELPPEDDEPPELPPDDEPPEADD
jgi:hypothetical protein